MSTTAYSHRIRLLACANCGAPVDAAIDGGAFRCEYCGTVNTLDRRDEGRDLERAREGASAPISESERLSRLRDQAWQGQPLPASISTLLSPDGMLVDIDGAKAQWLRARAQLYAAPSFQVSERFFYLTIFLVPHVDERVRRALLESAIELLPDEGHRHILRCVLARSAARAGDLAAAEQWLAPCNPRPLDLPMDTAYRYAAATLATARREYAQVLAILAMAPDDVPLAERDELGCSLLRIHALENTPGHEAGAVAAMRELCERYDLGLVERAIEEQNPFSVCRRSLFVVVNVDGQRAIARIEEELQRPWFDATKVKVIVFLMLVFSSMFFAVGYDVVGTVAFVATLPVSMACTALIILFGYMLRVGRRRELAQRLHAAQSDHAAALQRLGRGAR